VTHLSRGEKTRAAAIDRALVVAARAGDERALNDLIRRHLPMVYNLVEQALPGHPDVDDAVQNVLVRAVRKLSELREPESFRPWLAAIAVHEIGTQLARNEAAAHRVAALDDVIGRPDIGAEVEGPAVLRAELTAQRRQVRQASRWLDQDNRALLSLWWLETAGELSRADVATALGVNVAHAGVRIQRMRDQLDASREIVAALEAVPGCGGLGMVVGDWDGRPSPFWRKRIARHVRSCATCASSIGGLVATDRLLPGLVLLPVPAALAGGWIGKGTLAGSTAQLGSTAASSGGVKMWLLGRVVEAAGTHPVVAGVTAAAMAAGITLSTTAWPTTAAPPQAQARPGSPAPGRPWSVPPGASSPPTATGPLTAGAISLESANAPGTFVSASGDSTSLTGVDANSDATARRRATFEAVPGLADARCFSFRAVNGRYLRHSDWRLRLDGDAGTVLFRRDATFCPRPGTTSDQVFLESSNYPGWFVRHLGRQLWVDQSDHSEAFRADSSFRVRPPLG
jgi:RNA polymerase sigma factor (sigma-70 family)